MALQRTLQVNAITTGQNEQDFPSQQLINNNAPEEGSVDPPAGDVQVLVPAGVTVNGVWIKPPPNSTNAKTIRNQVGDSQSPPFTNQPVMYPCTAGGSFWLHSAGQEYGVKLVWF